MTHPGSGGATQQPPSQPGMPGQPGAVPPGPPQGGAWQQQPPPQGQWQSPPVGGQWGPPPPGAPKPKSKKGKVTFLVLLVVLALAGGGLGVLYWIEEMDSNETPPPDTSMDLTDAPMGCGLFTEDELRPLIPGTFNTKPSSGTSGDSSSAKAASCMFSNQKTHRDEGTAFVFLDVHVTLHKANHEKSGVEKAQEDLRRKPGTAIGVSSADDDRFREIDNTKNEVTQAQLSVRYHNVIISLIYHHDALSEGRFAQPMMQVAELALSKTIPPEQRQAAS